MKMIQWNEKKSNQNLTGESKGDSEWKKKEIVRGLKHTRLVEPK